MYPVSADFHNLSIADAPTSRVRIYFIEANVDCTDDNDVQSNGTLLCMPGETDSNGRIEKGGVTINEFFNSDANVQIGATVSSQIGMTLINRDGALDGFNYGRCKLYIDVYDDTNSTWLTCPMGVYNIAIPKRRKVQLVSATGYDQMQQLDEIADSWWNGLDWSNGITLLQIIQSMAATLGIHLSANTSANIVNSGLSYTEIPFTAIEMTYRDILSYIAEATGTIARFDRNGALDLRWFSDAVLSTDTQTYAGGLVTFTATNRASISSLSVPFSPIQDLHGYANPWPAGGGVNKLPNNATNETKSESGVQIKAENGVYTITGTPTEGNSIAFDLADSVDLSPSTNKIAFLNNVANAYIWVYFCRSGTAVHFWSMNSVNRVGSGWADSGNEVVNQIRIAFNTSAGSNLNITVSPMLIATSETNPTSFSPYSNICPISGRTGVSVYVSPTQNQADATTYTVDWTTEAGTVYGGTLDVVTGVLTVDRASVDMGTLTWFAYGGTAERDRYITGGLDSLAKTSSSVLCSIFRPRIGSETIVANMAWIGGGQGRTYATTNVGAYANAAAFKTAMSGQQLVYELSTPLTYQLTAQEVEALVGTNNVWSTGDSVSVTVSEPTLVEIQTDTVGNQCLSIDVGEFQVSQIDALSVKASQADVGVTIGSGGNAYTILDNPMLFGDEAAITTKATPIYNRLSAFRLFTPISMRCIMDWSIEAGDIITVTNESVTYDLPIFQQRLRWRGGYVVSDLFSSGEQERPTQSKEIRSSFRSNTQMHEFEVTLEQLRSYIQSVDGNYTLIQQTVDAITQTVANQNVTIQNILDPTGEIWTAITKNTSNLSSIEDSLNNEITERKSYIRFIPSEPAIVMGVDEDNEIKLKLVNNIIYFFNGADDSTDLSLAYAYFNSQEAFADRFVAGESVQIGTNDNAAHWLWKKLNNGDLVLELVG